MVRILLPMYIYLTDACRNIKEWSQLPIKAPLYFGCDLIDHWEDNYYHVYLLLVQNSSPCSTYVLYVNEEYAEEHGAFTIII